MTATITITVNVVCDLCGRGSSYDLKPKKSAEKEGYIVVPIQYESEFKNEHLCKSCRESVRGELEGGFKYPQPSDYGSVSVTYTDEDRKEG